LESKLGKPLNVVKGKEHEVRHGNNKNSEREFYDWDLSIHLFFQLLVFDQENFIKIPNILVGTG
jgi:hypothetical protein